jgi:hypothetical protein
MIDKTHLDFLIAWGEEFAGAVAFVDGLEGVTQHDGYQVFVRAFKEEPTPRLLARLTNWHIEQLRMAAQEHLEHQVPIDRVRDAVKRTLVRWPADQD